GRRHTRRGHPQGRRPGAGTMRRSTAQIIEDALWEATRAALGSRPFRQGGLAAAITERSRRYTSERELLAAPLTGSSSADDLAARGLFFTVAAAGRRTVPPAELERADLLSAGGLRLLDLGAGCGAMSFGALELAARRGVPLSVTAID